MPVLAHFEIQDGGSSSHYNHAYTKYQPIQLKSKMAASN
jgi:hypothetical protein